MNKFCYVCGTDKDLEWCQYFYLCKADADKAKYDHDYIYKQIPTEKAFLLRTRHILEKYTGEDWLMYPMYGFIRKQLEEIEDDESGANNDE